MAAFTQGKGQWLLPLSGILLVMGGLVGVQVHTQAVNQDLMWSRSASRVGEVLRSNQTRVQELKDENAGLRTKLARYESEAGKGAPITGLLSKELQNARIGLGQVALRGPGVVLELGDSTTRLSKDFGDSEAFVLHDWDVIQVVNMLWASGAEAVSVNGQRLVTGSAVVCSGPLVQVNHETIPTPFVFSVIGDTSTLLSGLNMRGGLLDTLRGYGFKVTITKREVVEVPAIAVSPRFKYARPVLAEQQAANTGTEETVQ